MNGHIVLSLLVILVAFLQVCTAGVVVDGEYIFLFGSSASLVAFNRNPGTVTMIARNTAQFHTWRIENRDNDAVTISIRTPKGDRLYVSPMEKADKSYVFLKETEFLWKLTQQGDKFVIGRADDDAESQLVLAAPRPLKFPAAAMTGFFISGDENQLWKLVLAGNGFGQQETNNHCGPWRLPRNPFQLQ
ncbi:MAG: hypothetical protein J3Q66DRAFT_350341 [Benniella sp.]|nr:MAG: hypothetical protein J3Q66DRAFT_350341 [Benniella sp.]